MGSIAITCCSTKEDKILENDTDNITNTKPLIYKYPINYQNTSTTPILPPTYVYNTPEINFPRTLSTQTIVN